MQSWTGPEILSVLFYPRKEDDSFDRRKGGFEMLIPVAEHVSVGACLYQRIEERSHHPLLSRKRRNCGGLRRHRSSLRTVRD